MKTLPIPASSKKQHIETMSNYSQGKDFFTMANENRTRKNELKVFLSDDEKYILEQKFKLSQMKSRSAFIRHLILYGYVYDVDYKELRNYNTNLSRIGNRINQIVARINKSGNFYEEDVKEIKELMQNVWRTQESMLSKQPYLEQ